MNEALISSPIGVLTTLCAVTSFFFLLETRFRWPFFQYLPPLLFIYAVPVVLSNTGVIPAANPIYDGIGSWVLPVFLTIMLLDIDVKNAIRVMGTGIFVMLIGSAGVVLGAPVAYMIVKHGLGPEAWKGFGALAGSWIGGTGNMAAVAEGLDTPSSYFGLAAISDNLVYVVWLPIMLGSKNVAARFHRFTRVGEDRLERMETAANELEKKSNEVALHHVLYLAFIGLTVAWFATALADRLPVILPVLSTGTWKILIVTTAGIALSFTPARKIPGSHPLAMALVYLFVARMGARAELSGLAQAPWFVAGAFIWIFLHGLFVVIGARIFRVDVHTAAIASAANIGGIASAPIVAAYHRKTLIPVSILMALIGYAVGNYLAILAAQLCFFVGR